MKDKELKQKIIEILKKQCREDDCYIKVDKPATQILELLKEYARDISRIAFEVTNAEQEVLEEIRNFKEPFPFPTLTREKDESFGYFKLLGDIKQWQKKLKT